MQPPSSVDKDLPIGQTQPPVSQKKVQLLCPSAQAGLNGSRIFGVVETSNEQSAITYLQSAAPITAGTLAAFSGVGVCSTEIFRFAAPCEQSGCANWSGTSCRVAEKLVQIMPATESIPSCFLRPACRWYSQEGAAACSRCSRVLTNSESFEEALNRVGPERKQLNERLRPMHRRETTRSACSDSGEPVL